MDFVLGGNAGRTDDCVLWRQGDDGGGGGDYLTRAMYWLVGLWIKFYIFSWKPRSIYVLTPPVLMVRLIHLSKPPYVMESNG